jgi:NADH:ubiquinone oxidoreductase subunit
MTIGTRLYTLLNGKHVGNDMFGNRYYVTKRPTKGQRQKRWVMYKGIAEPSKIPPIWHGWMHHMIDTLPTEMNTPVYPWQKEHLPNLTGTVNAYRPRGDLRQAGKRDASTSDYDSWTPEA